MTQVVSRYRKMQVENQLSMSLDDIINKNKKQKPLGNQKQQVMSSDIHLREGFLLRMLLTLSGIG